MARPSKYDWEDIRKHYEAGYTQPEILAKFKCPKSSLSEKVKKENWAVSELAVSLNDGLLEVSEQKSSLTKQDIRLSEIVEDKAQSEIRRRGLIFDATERIINLASGMVEKNSKQVAMKVKEYSKENGSTESLDVVDVELDSSDLKNLVETVDKASVTLGINQRHAPKSVTAIQVNDEKPKEIRSGVGELYKVINNE